MIPLSVGELTINQFHAFQKAVKTGKTYDLITLFTGLTSGQIDDLPLKKVENFTHRIGFLISDYNDLIEGKSRIKPKKYLFIKGKLFKSILNADKLNTNQYTALKTFNPDTQLNDVCSVIFTPLSGFDKTKTKEISELFKEVKVKKVYGAVFFYTNELKKRNKILKASLIQAKLNLMEKLIEAQVPQEVLDKVMAGITL